MSYFDYVLGLDPKLLKKTKRTRTKTKPKTNKVTIHHTETFHKKKRMIPRIIKQTIGAREIIYGEHALKARFPNYLERHTQDYDVYSPTPLRDARQAEHALDKNFRGNFFYTKKAQHPGTYKVVAYANEEGYADFTKKPRNVPHENIRGHNYVNLNIEMQHRKKSLRDPEYSWRHAKDRDALNRMKIYLKEHGRQ